MESEDMNTAIITVAYSYIAVGIMLIKLVCSATVYVSNFSAFIYTVVLY